LLDYYRAPGIFTRVEGFEDEIDALPSDVAAIAGTVQGLLIHEAWAPLYKVALSPERSAEKELHGAVAMLTRATRLDGRPIREARSPEHRVVGVCRHFATLLVAFLRRKGIPARVRGGFADYFEPGKHVEHWVGEYWRADQRRWLLVDAQIDSRQKDLLRPNFDPRDVPRDRFLVAGDAWRTCRSGADPMSFGVGGTPMWGLLEVFGEVFQDLAALQKIELLPWGWYGLATDKGTLDSEADLIDRLADLSSAGDANAMEALAEFVGSDKRLAVPAATLSNIIAADEAIALAS
jgi:hypothetical protein